MPLWQGEFVLAGCQEDSRGIEFHTPLQVNWWSVPEESTPEQIRVDILLDIGMSWLTSFSRNPTTTPYDQQPKGPFTPESLEVEVKRMLTFEFIHSFFHPDCDPNYTMLNWALYGIFRDKVNKREPVAAIPALAEEKLAGPEMN